MNHPRLLIEEWLPAQALGVECMRERGSSSALAPHTYLHVWWARRPLTAARAAVLASLLPADFDRATFERLVGFGRPGKDLVRIRSIMDRGIQVEGSFGCKRAFTNHLRPADLKAAQIAMSDLWGDTPTVIDPMSGGGSIPLESARLGLTTLANELNPVACTVLEATIDYPFRFGRELAKKTRHWGKIWESRVADRLTPFYPKEPMALVHAYIFARTVPCPDTGHPTPLVPDWSLFKPKIGRQLVAVPRIIDKAKGKWTVDIKYVGKEAGETPKAPLPTYKGGQGTSLFTGTVIPGDYIKAQAQQGRMGSVLYAIATKATSTLTFRPTEESDLEALTAAEEELARLRPQWERDGVIPTEERYKGDCDRSYVYGMTTWASMFNDRQLLTLGVLVEELHRLRSEIVSCEGEEWGEAIEHMLVVALNKFINHNCNTSKWENTRGVIKGKFDRHDFAFRATYAELAACVNGAGFEWAVNNITDAYDKLAGLPHAPDSAFVAVTRGSATNLAHLDDGSVTAVVVDPPYADNVQYAELADFFYVWLKRTQGHRRPEWFASYLTDKDEEAVVNISRNRKDGEKAGIAKARAEEFYQGLMTDVFCEAHRVLRDDGVLTVMFTHKKQSAWAALFGSLAAAGFTITSTFPVQTESQHSLHQAKKNAAQSTVILAARKRDPAAKRGYYDEAMRAEIRQVAQSTAARLQAEGLNKVDQLVGAFGPAMTVFTRYPEVRTDTGETVDVQEAIQEAANAVAAWRVAQLAERGLAGVDPESRFVLLCWDVLGAAEFRFNEAMLLGRAVGMDVADLKAAGLVEAGNEKVKLLSAAARRRATPVRTSEEQQLALFDEAATGRRRRTQRKVHPNDEYFASAIDMVHALAQRYAEAGGGQAGIGAARGMALQQGWTNSSPAALLMTALVHAAPDAVRFPGKKGKKTAADDFPEFRAWHALLKPLFAIEPPEWKESMPLAPTLFDLPTDVEQISSGWGMNDDEVDDEENLDEDDLDGQEDEDNREEDEEIDE